MAVTLSMLGTLIVSFFFIMSSLYFGRDGAFIAALPVKPRTVLSAKLAQVWISEVGFSLLIILPASILYGIKVHPDALFYLRALVVALCAPVLPIVIVAFVSTLLIRLSSLWKHRDRIATISGIVFIGAYMFLAFNMGSMTGSGEADDLLTKFMQSNTARIESMTGMFPPAAWAAKGLQGDWKLLLLFLAVCALAVLLAVWAIGFVYQKLSMLQGETPTETRKKGGTKNASFSGGSAFKALCLREWRQILRVPSYATNSLPVVFMPVFMVIMMYMVFNRAADEGESLEMLMSTINPAWLVPIMAAVMAYIAGMNPALSTSVSREGRGHDFMNSLPVSAETIIRSKLTVGYVMSIAGVLVAAGVLCVLFPAYALQAFLAFILCALYTYLTCCLSLSRDVKHPRLDWVTEQEAMKQNFGSAISLFIGWGILIALGVLTYFLFTWNVSLLIYFAIMTALLLLGCFLVRGHLMKNAQQYYCQG
jgi:ABC-2 type transport system permease protein